jgi:C_GCAxxG_C_C family probable redox protein
MNNKEKLKGTRRNFLQSAGLCLMACGLQTNYLIAEPGEKTGFNVLTENDRFDIGGRGENIIQKAYDLGYLYEEKHKGCARCTIAALQDAIDFLPADEALFRTASCLDGGATPTNSANCGAFTGSGMVIGWMCGTGRFGDNSLSHKLIHQVHKCFDEEYKSVICKEVRDKAKKKCPEVVAKSAKWTAEILLKQFTNYD